MLRRIVLIAGICLANFMWAHAQQNDPNYKSGRQFFDKNQFPQAVEAFTRAVESNKCFADAFYYRGQAYLFQGYASLAEKDFLQSEKCGLGADMKPYLYADLGMTYNQLEKDKEAIEYFNKAISLKPNFALAYNNRGISYQHQGDYRAAINDYSTAIKLDSNFALAYSNRGSATYYDQNIAEAHKLDIETAINDFTKALSLNPKLCVAMRNRGLCYTFLEKYDLALADLNDAALCEPDNPVNYIARGVVHYRLGEYSDAINDYMKALEIAPYMAEVYCQMGLAKMRMSYYEEAIADQERAINTDKRYKAWATYNIATVHALQGHVKETVQNLKKAEKAGYFRRKKNWEDFFKSKDFAAIAKEESFKKFADKLRGMGPSYFSQPK